MLYAVIVAGGQGTRLWPASRKVSPKQVRPFDGEKTMLQKTYDRVCQVVSPERVLLVTNHKYIEEVRKQIPQLMDGQIIIEPSPRNTAPAVGLAAAVLAKRDPEAVMLNVWADHYIKHEDVYKEKVLLAEQLLEANPQYLIDIVAKPEYPATGYGYLEAGAQIADELWLAKRFVEKPDTETAQQYLEAGNYYWNTAIFVWKVRTLLDMYAQFKPEMHTKLMLLQQAWDTENQEEAMLKIFPYMESISVDYAIFEKATNIALIPASLGWRDVGSWDAMYDVLKNGDVDEVVTQGKVIKIDTKNALIFNENKDKLVAVVGMEDVTVVDTPDALLVIRKSKDQDVKEVIKVLEATGDVKHL
ncbi:MAG: sugar phosphate nucleotidyltransferase [Patescibacteria group bacterium]|nr:sugar phosphate nucleotidyltransferase [Patescibacteria group bacterium]